MVKMENVMNYNLNHVETMKHEINEYKMMY